MTLGSPEDIKLEIAINSIEIFRERHGLQAHDMASNLCQPTGYQIFNPSLTVHDGSVYSLCRSSNVYIVNDRQWLIASMPRSTDNYLGKYRDVSSGVEPVKLDLSAIKRALGLTWMSIEDIRLFSWKGGLWALGAIYYSNTNEVGHESSDLRPRQILFRITDNKASDHLILPSPLGCQYEKNWLPHVVGDRLYLVYSVDPLTVFQLVDEKGLRLIVGKPESHGKILLRGGSQLVEVNDAFVCIGHARPIYANKTYYLHRFALISKDFQLIETSHPFFLHRRGVEFASGMINHAGHIHLSYGVADKRAYSLMFPAQILDSYLLT